MNQSPRHSREIEKDKTATWLLILLLAIYLLTFRGYYGGDHFYSYMTAESLVRHHTLALSEELSDVPDIAERQAGYLRLAGSAPNGSKYSHYGFGTALAMAIFYAIGHIASRVVPSLPHDYLAMATVSSMNAILTALTGIVLLSIYRRFFAKGVAVMLVLFYAFGTMAWNNAQYGYAEPLNLLLLMIALRATLLWQDSALTSRKQSAIIGVALGLAIVTEVYSAAIVGLCIGVYMIVLVLRGGRSKQAWQSLLVAGAAALPCVAFLLGMNWVRHGVLLVPSRLYGDFRLIWIPFALYGYLFSSGKSLFAYCPILLMSLWGIRRFISRFKLLSILIGAITVCSILPIATWINYWNGDLAWGPRFLFHLVPLLLLPTGEVLAEWWRLHRLEVWLISASALLVNLASVLVNQGRYVAAMDAHGLTERLFTPYLSPIVGHWLLIVSRLKTILTGSSLVVRYPSGPWSGLKNGPIVDLGPYDALDLWFINIPRQVPGQTTRVICVVGALALAILAAWSGWHLRHEVSPKSSDWQERA